MASTGTHLAFPEYNSGYESKAPGVLHLFTQYNLDSQFYQILVFFYRKDNNIYVYKGGLY